jgi:hypothetical protein
VYDSGVIPALLVSKSMSFHLSCHASPLRIPVSLRICRKVDIRLLQAEISWSISVSLGMKGILWIPL